MERKEAIKKLKALEQEPTTKNEAKYCDRNICLKNEYNNIGCEDCEVTKSQEPTQSPIIDWNNCRTSEQLDSIATTKNDLGVDCIDRKAIEKHIEDGLNSGKYGHDAVNIMAEIHFMPSVAPQESKKETITYLDGFADGLNMANNSTNKMLDKIRAEIIESCGYSKDYVGMFTFSTMNVQVVLSIIDKYKLEVEPQERSDK